MRITVQEAGSRAACNLIAGYAYLGQRSRLDVTLIPHGVNRFQIGMLQDPGNADRHRTMPRCGPIGDHHGLSDEAVHQIGPARKLACRARSCWSVYNEMKST